MQMCVAFFVAVVAFSFNRDINHIAKTNIGLACTLLATIVGKQKRILICTD